MTFQFETMSKSAGFVTILQICNDNGNKKG